jgi:geranylgeranyl diphosphate synthase type I
VIRTLPRVLERARTTVTPALGAAIERLAPVVRRPALYHCGFIDVDGRPTNGGGKHVRAALALLSAGAVGADEIVAIPGAVAIELVHNFSLLHDDIIDNDRERRHRPTV